MLTISEGRYFSAVVVLMFAHVVLWTIKNSKNTRFFEGCVVSLSKAELHILKKMVHAQLSAALRDYPVFASYEIGDDHRQATFF